MIVDKQGNMFEDRRKNKVDRRVREANKTSSNAERRKEERRKAPEQVKKQKYKK